MKRYPFKKIDAFASPQSSGNPAGYVRLESLNDISAADMLRIARELQGFVTEVGFAAQTGPERFDLRYYSAEREVEFCGHATIAIMHDIASTDPDLTAREQFVIHTRRGELTVENRLAKENSVYIMSPLPEKKTKVPAPEDIAAAFDTDPSFISARLPGDVINAGLTTLLVPVNSLDRLLAIAPSETKLKSFCQNSGLDIMLIFSTETSSADNHFRVRVFAPTFGYLEDPATGSGNSAFGYYLLEQRLWPQSTVRIEQNNSRQAFNLVRLSLRNDTDGRQRVLFGGSAVTRIEGEYLLP
jgi:PhzF family phenazine biosynthesis protein